MSIKDLIEDKDSEIFLMSLPSIDTTYTNIDLLKQVYDGLLQKWFSMMDHKKTIDSYWIEVYDKDMAEHYVKNFYSNSLLAMTQWSARSRQILERDFSHPISHI